MSTEKTTAELEALTPPDELVDWAEVMEASESK